MSAADVFQPLPIVQIVGQQGIDAAILCGGMALQPIFAAADEFGQFGGGDAGKGATMTLAAAVAHFDEGDG